jgi:hypothetical protein
VDHYRLKLHDDTGTTMDEIRDVSDRIRAIVRDRLPEIRQAITRIEANLKG